MLKRAREFFVEKPESKKAKYYHSNMEDAPVLHAFHSLPQNLDPILKQRCDEQYEEIRYIQENWTEDNWARCGEDYFKDHIRAATTPATSAAEWEQRENSLTQINQKVIYSFIGDASHTKLLIQNKKLTRFPESIFDQPELAAYWSRLQSLFLTGNKLKEIPLKYSQLQSLMLLELSNNQFPELPNTIALLQNLVYLSIGSNRLTSLPAELMSMPKLCHFYVSNNHLNNEQLLPFAQHRYGSEWFMRVSATQTPLTQPFSYRP